MRPLLLVSLLFTRAAFPTVVNPTVVQQQLAAAALVADIEIEGLQSFQDAQFDAKSHATARVRKIHAVQDDGGWFPRENETLVIETIGGEIGEAGVLYAGVPRAYVGKRYRATLNRLHDGIFQIVGMGAGLVPFEKQRGYSRNRTDGSNGAGSGAFLYWDPAYFPIPYYISLPTFLNQQEMVSAVDLSFKPWRDPGSVSVEFLPMGCTNTTVNRNDGINAIILVTSNWQFDNSAIAITRNFYVAGNGPKAGLILDTDIMINAVNHEFSTTGDVTKNDVRNIITHEVGHLLGLGHEADTKDTLATMYENALPGEINKRSLHRNDLAGLAAAYGGVGQKLAQFSSANACSVGWQRLSCLAVHGGRRTAGIWAWMAAAVLVALAFGRGFVRGRA